MKETKSCSATSAMLQSIKVAIASIISLRVHGELVVFEQSRSLCDFSL